MCTCNHRCINVSDVQKNKCGKSKTKQHIEIKDKIQKIKYERQKTKYRRSETEFLVNTLGEGVDGV